MVYVKPGPANPSLGERLQKGVIALFKRTEELQSLVKELLSKANSHGKVLEVHGLEIEAITRRVAELEREATGLRISKGKTKSKNQQLEAQLAESESKLSQIKSMLN